MKPIIFFQFILFSLFLSSQNLVLNPSFETHSTQRCFIYLGSFNSSISDWSIPNFGSTDYFDTCSEEHGSKNYNGFQNPRTGSSYAGLYLYANKNYREYVQGKLSKTLKKGKEYKMTFYLSLADKSSYALKDIEVLITEEKLEPCYHSNNCDKVIKPSKAVKSNFEIYSDSKGEYFSSKEHWMEYTFEFTAKGNENYFSIGNFYKNSKTKKQRTVSNSPFYFSYYYIDDVSVEAVEEEKPKEVNFFKTDSQKQKEFQVNKVYTFKNVLFDIDKSELLEASILELNELYKFLKENSNTVIEIYGHTDNSGIEKRNRELSYQRAKAVADYLILQGLDKSKIKMFGFGSSKPFSENNTEKGRALNRRVEFKLIQ